MMTNDREVAEGLLYQGEDERIAYTLDVSAVGVPSAPVVVAVKDVTTGSAVTSTVMPLNDPQIEGSTIVLSPLRALTRAHLYRVEVQYGVGGNTLESYVYIQAQE